VVPAVLVVGPFVFFATLYLFRTGRDLTWAFLAGCVLFFLVGVCFVVRGIRRRHHAWTISGIGLFVAILVSLLFCMDGILWVGSENVELTVHVADAETRQPITDALVRLSWDHDPEGPVSEGKTGADGMAKLRFRFWAYGCRTPVCDTGFVSFSKEALQVDAAGYQRLRQRLFEYAGRGRELHDPPPPPIDLMLKKATE
jgi:hypothetical protein